MISHTGPCPECGQLKRVKNGNEIWNDESCADCDLILQEWLFGYERTPTNQCSAGHGEYEGVRCHQCVIEYEQSN